MWHLLSLQNFFGIQQTCTRVIYNRHKQLNFFPFESYRTSQPFCTLYIPTTMLYNTSNFNYLRASNFSLFFLYTRLTIIVTFPFLISFILPEQTTIANNIIFACVYGECRWSSQTFIYLFWSVIQLLFFLRAVRK